MYLLRKVGKQLKGIFVKQPDNVVLPENTDSSGEGGTSPAFSVVHQLSDTEYRRCDAYILLVDWIIWINR